MERIGIGAASIPLAVLVACGTTIATTTTGSGGGSTGTAGGSTTTTSTTSTTTTTSTSTTSTTTTTAMCVPSCATDADCQASCPPVAGGTSCCDSKSGICFASSTATCPAPTCVDGAACKPSDPSCADPYSGCTCSCGADDHVSCSFMGPVPTCPAVHPTCGDPCVPPPGTCTCSLGPGQGTAGCLCGASGTWECAASGPCPPLSGQSSGAGCTDFPANLLCPLSAPTWVCVCKPFCGTQVWSCEGI